MREAIQSLMSNWAFSRGRPCPGHFVSTFSGGEAIRHWIVSLHGQLEGTKQISPRREAHGDYMMKHDLKYAYYTVPIHQIEEIYSLLDRENNIRITLSLHQLLHLVYFQFCCSVCGWRFKDYSGGNGLVIVRDIPALIAEIGRQGGVCQSSTYCFTWLIVSDNKYILLFCLP